MPRTVHADPPRSDFEADKNHGLLAYAVFRKITFYRLLSFTPRFLRISFLLAVKIISEFRFCRMHDSQVSRLLRSTIPLQAALFFPAVSADRRRRYALPSFFSQSIDTRCIVADQEWKRRKGKAGGSGDWEGGRERGSKEVTSMKNWS